MGKKNIVGIITEMVSPIVAQNNYELVDVEFLKEGAHWYLRVYIDKEGGVSLDDCQIISEGLSEALDKKDPIDQSYFLEVSSPGLDRPLKSERDFEKYKGEEVEVKLFQAIEGKKIFEGELQGLIDNKVCIKNKDSAILEFEREKIATVKRVIKF